jgi:hypothetical protein
MDLGWELLEAVKRGDADRVRELDPFSGFDRTHAI